MTYEIAMGTDAATMQSITREVEPEPMSEEQRALLREQREAERQHEIDTIWETGRWRETSMFEMWLGQKIRGERASFPEILVVAGPMTWIMSAHCLYTQQPCSNYAGREKTAAVAALLWPFATGYYAWRKSNGKAAWTAAGGAAGLLSTPIIVFITLAATGNLHFRI